MCCVYGYQNGGPTDANAFRQSTLRRCSCNSSLVLRHYKSCPWMQLQQQMHAEDIV